MGDVCVEEALLLVRERNDSFYKKRKIRNCYSTRLKNDFLYRNYIRKLNKKWKGPPHVLSRYKNKCEVLGVVKNRYEGEGLGVLVRSLISFLE